MPKSLLMCFEISNHLKGGHESLIRRDYVCEVALLDLPQQGVLSVRSRRSRERLLTEQDLAEVCLATDGSCELPSGAVTFPGSRICRDLHVCDLVKTLLLLLQSQAWKLLWLGTVCFAYTEAWCWASHCAIMLPAVQHRGK
ncbi:hypothetical protein P7K49_002639 [Saguinus oedipus]|uniref:Uncharacterized protein n=1 Tax=Saguinus oedipus TaxID=9490 RepID=A0ABQ9WKK7_SAGOE|nr:hypothetical protein P7K49_002639 [Saguinus oedipus]